MVRRELEALATVLRPPAQMELSLEPCPSDELADGSYHARIDMCAAQVFIQSSRAREMNSTLASV
jgi:hypothetical protein